MKQNPYAPPKAKIEGHPDTSSPQDSFLAKALNGKFRLWQVFWLGFVPALFVLSLLYSIRNLLLGYHFIWFVISLSILNLLTMSLLSTAVWRSAPNTSHQAWCYLAKIFVAVYLLWLFLRTLRLWFFWFHWFSR